MLNRESFLPDGTPIAWNFLPGGYDKHGKWQKSAQELALSIPANHILLTGGRGWGKTEVQLMRFRRNVGKGYGSFWRGIIFDREYKNLDDLITKSKRMFTNMQGPHGEFMSSNSALKWVWSTGEELLFRVAKDESDYWAYHGHEYAYVGWNELTKYPNNKLYRKMLSINRTGFDPEEHTPKVALTAKEIALSKPAPGSSVLKAWKYATPDGKPLPPIPLEVISTTNPYGVGHNWVKAQFIDVAPYFTPTIRKFVVEDAKTKSEIEVRRSQVTIFGRYTDNPYLSPEYIAGLMEETDENILKAWIEGDWDIVAGGALDDVWKRKVHVIPRFKIPAGWRVDRAFDWGSSAPFSVGWFAEANGEEAIMPDGRVFCPPRGTLIQIAEIYGSKGAGTNQGVKWTSTRVAEAIRDKEIEMMAQGWIVNQPSAGPADNQISSVIESDVDTIEKKMQKVGIHWERSDKSKGARSVGLELIRDRLEASRKAEGPGLYFMANCVASISTIPILPRDEKNLEDVDSGAEDHPYDMVRYRVLKSSNRTAKIIKVNWG